MCAKHLYLLDLLKILVQKTPESKKGSGSSQISRLHYRSRGSSCFRMKSRLEMAKRRPGQAWGLLPCPGHCLLSCTPFFLYSFLLFPFLLPSPPPPLPHPSLLHFLFILFFPLIPPWIKCACVHWKFSVFAWVPATLLLIFYFCFQFNNCLYTFLYLIILLGQQNQHLAFKNRIFYVPVGTPWTERRHSMNELKLWADVPHNVQGLPGATKAQLFP